MPSACVACHFHFPCHGAKIPPRLFVRNHLCSWSEQSEESSLQITYHFGATTWVELNTFVTGPSVWCTEVGIMIRLWLGQMNCGWPWQGKQICLFSKANLDLVPTQSSIHSTMEAIPPAVKWPGTKLHTLLHKLPKFGMHPTLYLQSSVHIHIQQTDQLYLCLFSDVQ